MKKPIYIAFFSQKGGSGKTNFTVLVASILHYKRGYRVAVADCNDPQHCIVGLRERDMQTITDNEYYKTLAYEQFRKLGKKGYPVVSTTPKAAIEEVERLSEDENFDFVFFDLPGTVCVQGVVNTITQMDYLFTPLLQDCMMMDSTCRLVESINDLLITTGKARIRGVYPFWNMTDEQELPSECNLYESRIEEMGISMLQTAIPYNRIFQRELSGVNRTVFRCTLLPADEQLCRKSRLDLLTDEILQLVTQKP